MDISSISTGDRAFGQEPRTGFSDLIHDILTSQTRGLQDAEYLLRFIVFNFMRNGDYFGGVTFEQRFLVGNL
jgi:hypothetical protein